MHATELSPKQARFVDEFLLDANGTQAAIRAGYGAAGARVAAYRLLSNVAISSLIETRRQADAARLSIDRDKVLEGLLAAVEMARELHDPAGMIAGLREIAKLQGYYAPIKVKTTLGEWGAAELRRLEEMTNEELLMVVRQSGGGVEVTPFSP